jgi:FAD/FMN-containing dehydrogenase
LGTCDDGLVIDLSLMKGMNINVKAKTVKAQAGLNWGEFDKKTQEAGLATTGGLVSTTGIAGFTLGGGFGWLVRKYGLTVDNLLSAEIVLADGKQVKASPEENAELFWGIRGGGGNFGIVTSFEYQLHKVGPEVFGGAIFFPLSKAKEFLKFYRDWTKNIPDELTTTVVFLTAPPEPFVPKDLIGTQMIVVALCYTGPIEDGKKLVQPLRNFSSAPIDLLGPIPYTALQSMFDSSAPKGIHSYWKTQHLKDISDEAIETIFENVLKMKSLSPFSGVHIHHWEGAVKRGEKNDMAFAHRDTRFVINMIGLWPAGEDADKHINWVRSFSGNIQKYATGQLYLNFLADMEESQVKAAFGVEKYDRLVALKNTYDPDNFFQINQNIRPTV